MPDLFSSASEDRRRRAAPLADRMRPRTLDEVVGQAKALGPGTPLRGLLAEGRLASLLLWGPPGSGKTTLARLCAAAAGARFLTLSAVSAGVADLRRVVAEAAEDLAKANRRTVLFVDEIHRFNKGQQDALLPHVEDGTVLLIGATTENPSFEVNSALLSRVLVVVLERLAPDEVRAIVARALADADRGLGGQHVVLTPEGEAGLVRGANGDARVALTILDHAVAAAPPAADGTRTVGPAQVSAALQRPGLLYDSTGEEHFNVMSALHKSVRGSDPDAALYWLARMLEAGEDPLYIARRIVRMASEDVGLADPRALEVAVAAYQAVHFLGMPEGDTALAQAAVYCAVAPKSNRIYQGLGAARRDVREREALPVPLHIRNAPTDLMKGLDYGKGYVYEPDVPGGISGQEFRPPNVAGRRYYEPSDQGLEAKIAERLARWAVTRAELRAATHTRDPRNETTSGER